LFTLRQWHRELVSGTQFSGAVRAEIGHPGKTRGFNNVIAPLSNLEKGKFGKFWAS
jgi:hypothetical protein